jgi:hydrogenase maturation protease
LCLGNEILSDDAFGYKIAQLLTNQNDLGDDVQVVFSSQAGFNLLDLLKDRSRVLIVDTIKTGSTEPGTLHYFPMGQLTPSHRLTCSHEISLPTAIEFGRNLGISMPPDLDVLAVEAKDTETLSEHLTKPVEDVINKAIAQIREWADSASRN